MGIASERHRQKALFRRNPVFSCSLKLAQNVHIFAHLCITVSSVVKVRTSLTRDSQADSASRPDISKATRGYKVAREALDFHQC